ncbi:hypothetical protein CVT26_005058 [Gymnopilus dilepis]|uniref:Uncharacterized protein n=1 Tax=Gymnopilus dilepis TaxID=231916 RepID=A0A409W8A3_9AGAR|nr:hypothetical protein CVT26_005058 [Gymnopilus dilepis]
MAWLLPPAAKNTNNFLGAYFMQNEVAPSRRRSEFMRREKKISDFLSSIHCHKFEVNKRLPALIRTAFYKTTSTPNVSWVRWRRLPKGKRGRLLVVWPPTSITRSSFPSPCPIKVENSFPTAADVKAKRHDIIAWKYKNSHISGIGDEHSSTFSTPL